MTIGWRLEHGKGAEIEERGATEVTQFPGRLPSRVVVRVKIAPPHTRTKSPAFGAAPPN